MARRRRRAATKRRTRRSTGFNIRQAAFALGTAQIATKALTGAGIWNFFTAGTPLNATMTQAGWTSANASSYAHKNIITLKEIMAGMHLLSDGSPYAGGDSIAESILKNLMANGFNLVLGIGGLKVADKLLGKAGVWRNTNKMLDAVGVKSIVRV